MNDHFWSRPAWQALALGLAACILYGVTAAPSIFELYSDSLEFQLIGPTFGIAHPTGYPLYSLLSGLWSRLIFPFGNWAWRMNLLSSLFGGGTIAVLFLLARRLSGSGWGGLVGAVLFGLSSVWWAQTTAAEVYGLHLLLVAGILYAGVSLGVPPRGTDADSDSQVNLAAVFLLLGLGLAHHRTTVLLLPGLAVYLFWCFPRLWRPQKAWIGWGMALLLPMLFYLYIPLRARMGATDLEGAYVNSWGGFWQHVLATGYTGFFSENALSVQRSTQDWLALFVSQFGWPGLILGGIGLLGGLVQPRLRPSWVLILLVLLANALFGFNYRVGDAEVFFLPVFFCLALGIGNGVELIRRLLPWQWLILPLILALMSGFPGRAGPVNRQTDWAVHDYAVALAKVDFPPDSLVVGLRGQMTALMYMQQAEGLGRNAIPVALDDPVARRVFVEESVAQGKPVYLTQELGGIEESFSFSGFGPLVRVWPRGAAQAGLPANRLDLLFDADALGLLGADLTRLEQAGGPALEVVFYWQPTRRLQRNLKLSLRLLGADGSPIVQSDRFPLRQVAPSWSWQPGEVVRDVHSMALSSPIATSQTAASQTATSLLVIVYDADTVEEVGRVELPVP